MIERCLHYSWITDGLREPICSIDFYSELMACLLCQVPNVSDHDLILQKVFFCVFQDCRLLLLVKSKRSSNPEPASRSSSTNHLSLLLHLIQDSIRNSKCFHPSWHTTIRTDRSLALLLATIPIEASIEEHLGTHEACNKASLISTSVTPFLTAPRT